MSEFDKYIVQGEPDKKAKANAWQTAIGLQDVDGLKPSEYLIKTAVQPKLCIKEKSLLGVVLNTYLSSIGIFPMPKIMSNDYLPKDRIC